jgi:hypothetical protein
MKPTKTFKLSKTTKRMMSTLTNAEARNEFKRIMIQGQLAAQVVIKKEKADK